MNNLSKKKKKITEEMQNLQVMNKEGKVLLIAQVV